MIDAPRSQLIWELKLLNLYLRPAFTVVRWRRGRTENGIHTGVAISVSTNCLIAWRTYAKALIEINIHVIPAVTSVIEVN